MPTPEVAEPPPELLCHEDGVGVGLIEVDNQAQLDRLEGCENILGDLSLHLFAGIDEAPLRSLRIVQGRLSVYGASEPIARPLEGFRSLEQVGVQLVLSGLSVPDLADLGRLRWIGTPGNPNVGVLDFGVPRVLELSDCTGLTSLAGLGALEQVQRIELSHDSDLVSVAGLGPVRKLEAFSVADCPLLDLQGLEPLAVRELSLSGTALTNLQGLGNAAQLRKLTLNGNAALVSLEGAAFPAQLEQLRLEQQDALPNLKGLEALREVADLSILGNDSVNLIGDEAALNTGIASLTGLERLEVVGNFELNSLPRLTDLSSLDALVSVEHWSIVDNPGLLDLAGMPLLKEVAQLSVVGNLALTSLHGLGTATLRSLALDYLPITNLVGLEQVNLGDLSIFEDLELSSLSGFPPQLSTLGALSIEGTGLTDLQELTALTSLRELRLTQTGLRNLDGLSNVRQLDTLVLENNLVLEAGPTLPLLEQAETIVVSDNRALTELAGFSALRSVKSLLVANNPKLLRLELPLLSIGGKVIIRNTDALADAALAALRQLPVGVVLALSTPSSAAQLSPCPWVNDHECDENYQDCAAGSDVSDCRCRNVHSDGLPTCFP